MADAEPKKVIEKHTNIFAALAAFQSENPEIKKTKEFGKEGDAKHWWYAPLDEVLQTVRPLTSKHGLAFTWEQGDKEGEMVCALYHETYKRESKGERTVSHVKTVADVSEETSTTDPLFEEHNVMRSMPVSVARKGDMKAIGSDSTYARRYTLAEVLGIAPDEDKDADATEKRRDSAEKTLFAMSKKGIESAKTEAELAKQAEFLSADLDLIAAKKTPKLGLDKDQIAELQALIAKRVSELKRGGGKDAPWKKEPDAPKKPGENEDDGKEVNLPK